MGQRRTAELLLELGADIDGHPDYADQTPIAVAGSADTRRGILVDWLRNAVRKLKVRAPRRKAAPRRSARPTPPTSRSQACCRR